MTDLVDFLRARLEEDEVAACTASPSPWKDPEEDEAVSLWLTREDAYHIYRWEPARVLREVEAKRQTVTEHYVTQGVHDGQAYRVCTRCSDYAQPGELFRPEMAPCRTLRLLALPYADHPDYRQEWKP